jgi:predicted house-cleaning noncanonical NTP pyrophosphatase (MazG superfamily)
MTEKKDNWRIRRMNINIDEKELSAMIEKKLDEKIDNIIKDRIQEKLFDRVTGIFNSLYGEDKFTFEHMVEKILREEINKKLPDFLNESTLDNVSKSIASEMAYRLKDSISYAVFDAFKPYMEDDEDEY